MFLTWTVTDATVRVPCSARTLTASGARKVTKQSAPLLAKSIDQSSPYASSSERSALCVTTLPKGFEVCSESTTLCSDVRMALDGCSRGGISVSAAEGTHEV